MLGVVRIGYVRLEEFRIQEDRLGKISIDLDTLHTIKITYIEHIKMEIIDCCR